MISTYLPPSMSAEKGQFWGELEENRELNRTLIYLYFNCLFPFSNVLSKGVCCCIAVDIKRMKTERNLNVTLNFVTKDYKMKQKT